MLGYKIKHSVTFCMIQDTFMLLPHCTIIFEWHLLVNITLITFMLILATNIYQGR